MCYKAVREPRGAPLKILELHAITPHQRTPTLDSVTCVDPVDLARSGITAPSPIIHTYKYCVCMDMKCNLTRDKFGGEIERGEIGFGLRLKPRKPRRPSPRACGGRYCRTSLS